MIKLVIQLFSLSKNVDEICKIYKNRLPGCLHVTQALFSELELSDVLTLSIISPLGRLGITGNEPNDNLLLLLLILLPFWSVLGLFGGTVVDDGVGNDNGEILSCFFLTDCRVCGGDMGDIRKAFRLRFWKT